MNRSIPGLLFALALAHGSAFAQASAGYKVTESTFNNGGDPSNGSFAASSGYHVRLDALGGVTADRGLSSPGYHADGGFVAGFPPPVEVLNLKWTSSSTMVWDPEKSVGSYALYRGLVSTLPGGFGTCLQSNLISETANDPAIPPFGAAWFYLVTARNALAEEGTKGHRSDGLERPNPAPCP
jgi:hypothetical protein